MAKTIAICNQKGGVAKTTTALALAAGLKKKGAKVLLIDTDPQGNSSDTYRAKIENTATLYDVLCEGEPIINAIQKTEVGDIIPSDPYLSEAESRLTKTGKEFILKKAASTIMNKYDYIIIDTPPSLGVLLINVLTFADEVIVPITTDRYGLQGIDKLQETITAAREYTNPNLRVSGLLLVKYNNRTLLSREVSEGLPQIAEILNTIVYKTTIRESIAVREAQALRTSIFDHAPKSTTAQDYMALINELNERGI